ncbi:unnamed protein product [Plutella xylostella]|uniref:(diamondback moth) hypothetical protein n=1 Tax=Plutella xylostella TaxID=51655 RepID=A0A8S4FZ52_PLUXY|nr:unnamed protein product [Plutella xylostella]
MWRSPIYPGPTYPGLTLLTNADFPGVTAEYKLSDEQKNKFHDMVLAQCQKNKADGSAQQVEAAGNDFLKCFGDIIDPKTLRDEIEAAKPNGALDEVFKKYCAKSAQLKTCVHTLTGTISPCLDAGARQHLPLLDNGTDQLLDFVCYKDGDRIALFIAEQGPECIQAKMPAIRACVEPLLGNEAQAAQLETLTLNEQCAKADALFACVVKALEQCDTPTPANMAEALFRFVRKGSPCKSVVKN